jgi:DNA-binding transcriptional regulator LsrR (DeoR family)
MTKDIRDFTERDELLFQCAELFYVKNLSKREIAHQLHVSPTHVKRLLDEAIEKSIVEVEIKLAGRFRRIENALIQKYRLRFARVVETHSEYDTLKTNLGVAAAEYFDAYIQRRSRVSVGIGGGGSLLRMVELLERKPRSIDIYPMSLLGRGPLVEFVSSTYLAIYLLTKSLPLATGYVVGFPPIPSKPKLAATFAEWVLREIPEVKQVYEGSKSVELAFVGVGNLVPSRDIFGEFSKLGYSLEYMQRRGVVGGINYNYFDAAGDQVGKGILTLSVDDLKDISNAPSKIVVVVGGGIEKKDAIRVALRTKMVNSIITDEDVARYLLKKVTE